MNACDELQKAYEEWRRLARAEGEAIRNCNWSLVAQLQNAIQEAQAQILQYSDDARSAWASLGPEGAAREKSVRALIAELIEIERQNNSILASVRQAAQAQFGELKLAGHTLRQVQRSYAPPRLPVWTSFS
jgi:hypothetical protein